MEIAKEIILTAVELYDRYGAEVRVSYAETQA